MPLNDRTHSPASKSGIVGRENCRYSDSSLGGQSRDRIPGGSYSVPIQMGPQARPAPIQWVSGYSRG